MSIIDEAWLNSQYKRLDEAVAEDSLFLNKNFYAGLREQLDFIRLGLWAKQHAIPVMVDLACILILENVNKIKPRARAALEALPKEEE